VIYQAEQAEEDILEAAPREEGADILHLEEVADLDLFPQ
jgi:hypothetical protein